MNKKSGWSLETLEQYLSSKIDGIEKNLTTRLNGVEKSVETALASADKAVSKSDQATERRFESVNEFRQTLQDQTSTFLPRAEYQAQRKAAEDATASNSERISRIESTAVGKSEGIGTIGIIVIGISVILSSLTSVASLILTLSRK